MKKDDIKIDKVDPEDPNSEEFYMGALDNNLLKAIQVLLENKGARLRVEKNPIAWGDFVKVSVKVPLPKAVRIKDADFFNTAQEAIEELLGSLDIEQANLSPKMKALAEAVKDKTVAAKKPPKPSTGPLTRALLDSGLYGPEMVQGLTPGQIRAHKAWETKRRKKAEAEARAAESTSSED